MLGFGRLAAAACAGVRLSRFLGGCVGCGADLGGCAVAALVAGDFHGSSVYPRGVYCKGVLRIVTRCGCGGLSIGDSSIGYGPVDRLVSSLRVKDPP